MKHVPLPHGGSIVIEQTEALVAIDVNSGNFRADGNAEETSYQLNLHAAKEIARQLRLRDLGGVIVNDFIDMRDEKHRRAVEKALKDAIKRDRARTKVLRTSAFGIIEMTRQRVRPSLKRSVYQDCPHCLGAGQVKDAACGCRVGDVAVCQVLRWTGGTFQPGFEGKPDNGTTQMTTQRLLMAGLRLLAAASRDGSGEPEAAAPAAAAEPPGLDPNRRLLPWGTLWTFPPVMVFFPHQRRPGDDTGRRGL